MNVLFVTANRLGDAVLSMGLLGHLVDTMPAARFTIAVGPVAAPLFGAVPRLERVHIMAKERQGRHWLRLWWRVSRCFWHLVVDLRGSALAWLVPAGHRLVLSGGRDEGQHRVVRLGRLLGVDPPPAPRIWTSRVHDDLAAQLFPPGPPILALAPVANWGGKQWRHDRFVALAEQLTGNAGLWPGGRIAVLSAPDERPAAQRVIDALPAGQTIDLAGRVDLLAAAACLRRAAMFIGNDSGLMHLAAAMGTPTLGLFGPSPPDQYAPWGTAAAVITTDIPYAALVGAPEFDFRSHQTLMDSLAVDKAVGAAHDLWRRVKPMERAPMS
ncbi:MAG: glycosyltransferase family 9 protein [Alphaproteobacteria bacterium]|nr:glycosyltransferase family 9 protein [Alphaproteobacteria bacterium]